jgi:hypothetical protein
MCFLNLNQYSLLCYINLYRIISQCCLNLCPKEYPSELRGPRSHKGALHGPRPHEGELLIHGIIAVLTVCVLSLLPDY